MFACAICSLPRKKKGGFVASRRRTRQLLGTCTKPSEGVYCRAMRRSKVVFPFPPLPVRQIVAPPSIAVLKGPIPNLSTGLYVEPFTAIASDDVKRLISPGVPWRFIPKAFIMSAVSSPSRLKVMLSFFPSFALLSHQSRF